MTLFTSIKAAIKETVVGFKQGYAQARSPIHIVSTPTALTDVPAFNYESHIASMMKKHNVIADIIVTDVVTNMPMCVLAVSDLPLLHINIKTKNDTVLIADRCAIIQNLRALHTVDPVFEDMDIADLVEIIAAHELGHLSMNHVNSPEHAWKKEQLAAIGVENVAQHIPLFTKVGQLTIDQELEAWDTGKQYVPAHLLEAYNVFNRININTYKDVFNQQLGTTVFQ